MRILAEMENGAPQKRVGIEVDGRQPVREGARVLDGEGNEVGGLPAAVSRHRCSGRSPWAMWPPHLSEVGTALKLEQRGKLFDARVAHAVRTPPLSPQGSKCMTVYFTREYEWIRVEGDTATVGISDHAQQALGDIVFAEVPEAGRKLNKGQEAAVVEVGEGRIGRLCAGRGRGRGRQCSRRR